MSLTLTWYNSGLASKTGTAIGNMFVDVAAMVTAQAANANFSWQVASSNTGSSPYQITLKRKDGSAGRILLVGYSGAPAGINPTLFDVTPVLNGMFGAFFPAGNVDTPSNLSASSGVILGDDTGAVKAWGILTAASAYGASIQPFYFDSYEAVAFGFQNPGTTTCFAGACGYLVIDDSDVAYPSVFSTNGAHLMGASAGTVSFSWQSTVQTAGSAGQLVRANYSGSNKAYYQGFSPSGLWAQQAIGPSDILTDTSTMAYTTVNVQLLGQTKGEGFKLKLRQIGLGPTTTGAFSVYNASGPVVDARQFCAATAGSTTGAAWFTNYKI